MGIIGQYDYTPKRPWTAQERKEFLDMWSVMMQRLKSPRR